MGMCFSSWSNDFDKNEMLSHTTTANIITINGELRRFTLPITVSQVLLQLDSSTSSSFICNSDNLYYDEIIPALLSDCDLQSGQIYFVLPITKLSYPLSASEMASLAVKASAALSNNGGVVKSSYYCNNKSRVSPFLVTNDKYEGNLSRDRYNSGKSAGTGMTRIARSGSIRKKQRYSSRRVKLAARSFKLGLNTIYE